MIHIESEPKGQRDLELGDRLRLALRREGAEVETRAFLMHQRIFYLMPLTEWNRDGEIEIFPEAPGVYKLALEWRDDQGESGWEEFEFRVHFGGGGEDVTPFQIRLNESLKIWAPSELEAKLHRSSMQRLSFRRDNPGSERATFTYLRSLVRPGSVVYDVGANLGIYSIQLARRCGPGGFVYCFEANPVCVHYLRANLSLNSLDNVEILPVALLDYSGSTGFTINYGNSNLGLSEGSGLFVSKVGHRVEVPCFELDTLMERFNLRRPDLVKMDIEGAESKAVAGMRRTLDWHRPMLLLELHGRIAASETLSYLDGLDYTFVDPESRRELPDSDAVQEFFGDRIFQLAALPTLRDEGE